MSESTNANSDTEQQSHKHKFYESNAGDGTTVYDQYLHGYKLVMAIIACVLCLFLIGLDQTIVVTILETVGNKFDSYNNIGWISSGYMLTMSVFAATWGKISIIFGRKYAMLAGVVLFEAGSLMCALAPSMNVLIGGRILAGIGGGGIQSLGMVIATELTPIDSRAAVLACMTMSFAISGVIGPLIGGALTSKVTWRWCFYINLPIGGAAFLLLLVFLNPPKTKGTMKEKFLLIDYVGTVLLTGGLVVFLLGLTFGGEQFAWNSGAIIALFVVGGVTIIAFVIWNFKFSSQPIIPPIIMTVSGVVIPVFSLFIVFFCFMGASIYLSTYFQLIRNESPLRTGISLLAIIIPLVVVNVSVAILIKKTRYVKPFAVGGGLIAPIGLGVLSLLDVHSSLGKRIGLLILPGIFVGLLFTTSFLSIQISSPKEAGSTIMATTFANFLRALGGAIGSDLSETVFNSSYKNKVKQAYLKNPDLFEGFNLQDLYDMVADPALLDGLSHDSKELVLKALMGSIRNVFYLMTSLGCVLFLLTLFYNNSRVPEAKDVIHDKEEDTDNGDDIDPEVEKANIDNEQDQRTELGNVELNDKEATEGTAISPTGTGELSGTVSSKDSDSLKGN